MLSVGIKPEPAGFVAIPRNSHLEQQKLGHNPERPFVCSVCMKGFKRKEHLNLHFVIHSGEKTEICGECGKGFYRKDHLRKHARSHITRRAKEQAEQAERAQGLLKDTQVATSTGTVTISVGGVSINNSWSTLSNLIVSY